MFKIVKNENIIKVMVNNHEKVGEKVLDIMKQIDPDYKRYAPSDNMDLFNTIFKRMLLKELTWLELEKNKPYFVYVTLGKDKYNYVLTKMESDGKMESGYTMALTLQG